MIGLTQESLQSRQPQERLHSCEFQSMSGRISQKTASKAGVSGPGVPATDRGSKKVGVDLSDFGPAVCFSELGGSK